MAQKILTTRIKLKYDLEQNWLNSTTTLMLGETAYVVDSLTNPTWVKAKIGDGINLFKDLPYLTNMTEEESTDFI